MIKKLIIIGLILGGLTFVAWAAIVNPVICSECKLPIVEGDIVTPVMHKETIQYIHFKCALKKHLRTLPKD